MIAWTLNSKLDNADSLTYLVGFHLLLDLEDQSGTTNTHDGVVCLIYSDIVVPGLNTQPYCYLNDSGGTAPLVCRAP